jgi:hypothetical protein
MKKYILALALVLSAFIGVSAQAQSFVMQSSICDKNYSGTFTFGREQLMTLYPTVSNFNASSSGTCGGAFPYCNGLGVYITKGTYPNIYTAYATPLYVSPSQINILLPDDLPAVASDYTIEVDYSNATVERSLSSVTLDKYNIQPYIFHQTISGVDRRVVVAGIYGWNAGHTAVEFVTNTLGGTAVPMTHNGYPTIIQLNYTGRPSAFNIKVNGVLQTSISGIYSSGFDGIFVSNIDLNDWSGYNFTTGLNSIEMIPVTGTAGETTVCYIQLN